MTKGSEAFLTNRLPTDYPTRIELLFDLMAEKKTSNRFHTFHHFKQLLEQGRTGREALRQTPDR